MTTLEVIDIKPALVELDEVFASQREFGATDTEPDGVLHQILHSVLDHKEFVVPRGARGWQLYDMPGSSGSARTLAQAVISFIRMYRSLSGTGLQWANVRNDIQQYAWRISR